MAEEQITEQQKSGLQNAGQQNAEQQKNKRRYKLMLVSERKGKNVFSFSMPLWVTSVLFFSLAMLVAFSIVLLIMKTPLKTYLPGYLDVTKRAVVVESSMRLDSLERENELRIAYLDNIMSLLRERSKVDDIVSYDSAVVRIQDTLLTASEREMAFVSSYAERERFGIEAIGANDPAYAPVVFMSPVKGKIAVPEKEDEAHSGMTKVDLTRELPVIAPLEGTVISTVFLIGQGYQVTIQHSNDYVTIISHLASAMVEAGQQIKAGKVIGHSGNDKDLAQSWVGIQVWHKGKSVDAASIMTLE